MLWYC